MLRLHFGILLTLVAFGGSPAVAQAEADPLVAADILCREFDNPAYNQSYEACVTKGYAGDGLCFGYYRIDDAGVRDEGCTLCVDGPGCPGGGSRTSAEAADFCYGDENSPYKYEICVLKGYAGDGLCVGYAEYYVDPWTWDSACAVCVDGSSCPGSQDARAASNVVIICRDNPVPPEVYAACEDSLHLLQQQCGFYLQQFPFAEVACIALGVA